MSFTIRAFNNDTRLSTAISFSKDGKNQLQQVYPKKQDFKSLRGWMMAYAKTNPTVTFKMEMAKASKPVLPDNPTQALVRKYYESFGFENTITPRSNRISSHTPLYILWNGGFFPVFFNRQTGRVYIGAGNSATQLTDIETCKFFLKGGNQSFSPITLPEVSVPKPGQPVIAVIKSYYTKNLYEDKIKKQFEDAGYFVKDFFSANYRNSTMMHRAIWSSPNIRAAIVINYWYTASTVYLYTSAMNASNVYVAEWLTANPATPVSASSSSKNAVHLPLPPSPQVTAASSNTVAMPV